MPYTTEDYIHIPNPEHPESDFRLNNKGEINIVGTSNYGAGVQGWLGLLKGSGSSAVYVYLFKKDKFTLETANTWLDKHKGSKKSMNNDILTDKKFKFNMPLTKSYTDENDGYLYLEYALATTDVDLENEQLTSKCLKNMAEQATGINMYMDHKYTEETTLGPVVKAEIRDNQLWIKGRVRKSKTKTVTDLLEPGTHMGGSFGGICQKDYVERGRRMLDEVKLLDATLTPMPVNSTTSGTATVTTKGCTVCNQIFKSIEHKYDINLTKKTTDEPTPNSGVGDDGINDLNKSNKQMEELTMDDETIKQFEGLFEKNNETLVKGIVEGLKEAQKPEEIKSKPKEVETKQIDEDKLADKIRKGILKDLGLETEEPEKEPESGIMVLTKSALEDLQADAVQKALLSIGNQREGTRKSKSVGGSKFEIPKTEPEDEPKKSETGKLSTTKSAEALLIKKGVINAA